VQQVLLLLRLLQNYFKYAKTFGTKIVWKCGCDCVQNTGISKSYERTLMKFFGGKKRVPKTNQ